jgi:hypothetical protein
MSWFTGVNYQKLAVEKDHDSIFTNIWKPDINNPEMLIDSS